MKRVVISSFIFLVVLALIYAAYFLVQRYSAVSTNPTNAIPQGTLFFMESKNTRDVFSQLASENLLELLLGSDSSLKQRMNLLDSLLSSNDEIKKTLEEKPVYISAHLTKARSIDYLFLTNVSSDWTNDKAAHFISNTFQLAPNATSRIYEGVSVREMPVSPKRIFSFAVTKGIFVGSFTSSLIDESIRQLKSGASVTHSKAFSKIAVPSGNQQTSLYINYIPLGEFFSSYSNNRDNGVFKSISSFARWSTLDAIVQPNGLVFHGQTSSIDSSDYIAALHRQQPQKMEMTEIFPLRTALFIHLGLSDYAAYSNQLRAHSNYFDPPDQRIPIIRAVEEQFQINLEQHLTEWIDNEMALLVTEPGSPSFDNSSYACIKAKNIESALQNLSLIQQAVNAKKNVPPLSEYRKHTLGYIALDGLAPLFYGNLFKKINNFYFTHIGSYILIANQPSALRSFIDDYEDNKKLISDAGYKKLMQNSSLLSNFFLYANLDRSKNIFRNYASDDLIFNVKKDKNTDNRFSIFSFQLLTNKAGIETNMQLLKANEAINSANLLWSTQLDTSVSMPPFIMRDPVLINNFVIIQDEANNLYKLDVAGTISWKRKIPGKIMSDFYVVDVRKNGQRQILFNTASHLWLIDLNGDDYSNYPIRLPANATNGCKVIDFENSKDYKIIVGCSNRIVYAYEISGKPVTGWMFNQPVQDVVNPVQHFKNKNKDYLLIYNHHGHVFMLDKKGTVRSEFKNLLIAPKGAFSFVAGDSIVENHLVTSTADGKIKSLFFNGTVTSSPSFIPTVADAFQVSDIDGDGMHDYAFLTMNQIKVFRQDGSVVFSYVLPENGLPEFYSFSFTTSQTLLAIGTASENKFYILDQKGQLSNGFPVKGSCASLTNEWGNDGKKILMTAGTDGNVNAYIIN